MADPRFFKKSGPFTLRQLAEIGNAEIGGAGNPDQEFSDVAPLSDGASGDISFLDNKKYIDAFTVSEAGACIVDPTFAGRAPAAMALLLTPKPYQGYARIAAAFYPDVNAPADGTAVVHDMAHVDETATLGAGSRIEPSAVIGPGVVLGKNCIVGAGATIQFAIIGDGCIIHPGVRIGQDGFGFAPGGPPDGHIKVPQLGRVVIGDDVEIGANTTIDRGTGPDTVIGSGTKIDNLCQIAHNVALGEGCFLAAQVGISGSTKFGNYVMIGGKSGFAGHLVIGDGAQFGGHSAVMRDVEPGARMVGMPAVPEREFWRQIATIKRMTKPKKKET